MSPLWAHLDELPQDTTDPMPAVQGAPLRPPGALEEAA